MHLTNLGSYYVAAVTWASVFRRSPVGANGPGGGGGAATVTALQQIAWDYVQAYYADPASYTRTMSWCRTHVATQVCAPFWSLLGNPANTTACQNTFSNASLARNPFKDEATYTPLPAP